MSRGRAAAALTSVLLLALVAHGTAEKVHARLLQAGERLFTGYAELRTDPVPPDCDPDALEAPEESGTESDSDEELLDELFEEEPAATETAAPADTGSDDALLDDLFGDDSTDASAAAAEAARKRCKEAHAQYQELSARITPGLRAFRGVEQAVSAFVSFGVRYLRHALVILLFIGAITVTWNQAHIALRPTASVRDSRVSAAAQLVANMLLTVSWLYKWRIDATSGLELQYPLLPVLWTLGFATLSVISLYYVVRPSGDPDADSGWHHALLSVPLYAGMAVISGLYFIVVEQHPAGLAIYLLKLTEHALLYLHVGLYVWAGMLLKESTLPHKSFDLLRPWRLPPEILAFVVVTLSAIPTAYSGASGIFVIAAGALIYTELRRAGARQSLSLATTAMSGSLGVVLRPCLLVVVVASLNKQVTTDQLFGWGWRVFGLSSVLFLIASLLTRKGKLQIAKVSDALRGMSSGARALLPYVGLVVAVLVVWWLGLGTTLDEHTAPVVLPVLLLILLFFDRRPARREFVPALGRAAGETTDHIGALLMLMGLSVCLGGVIERSEVMALVPESFGNVWLTMSVLVVVLVLIGMFMDPYGAVILVSAAIAPIAYRNDIDPVHFWMCVLVAFELGYLTPPVALNHLLTRQVVGADEAEAPPPEGGFYRRHERVLLPIAVMATALLVVAFSPLLF